MDSESQDFIDLDVRVLATTNRDLRRYVADGKFREDLYYRLNVFPLHIPPLRERPLDILPLAERILARQRAADGRSVSLTEAAEQKLVDHSWPGNVRELENLLQRSLILLQGQRIDAGDLAFEHVESAQTDAGDADLQEGLKNREYQLIIEALQSHPGSRSAVADTLGISPRTLRYKLARMREAGIEIPGELS